MKSSNVRLWVTIGGIAASVLVVSTFAYAKFVSGVPEGTRAAYRKAAAPERTGDREPASWVTGFHGSVTVQRNETPDGRGQIFQVVDSSRNVICYGHYGAEQSAISCVRAD